MAAGLTLIPHSLSHGAAAVLQFRHELGVQEEVNAWNSFAPDEASLLPFSHMLALHASYLCHQRVEVGAALAADHRSITNRVTEMAERKAHNTQSRPVKTLAKLVAFVAGVMDDYKRPIEQRARHDALQVISALVQLVRDSPLPGS